MKSVISAPLLLACGFLFTVLSASLALGQSQPSSESVLDMLSGYEYTPSGQDLEVLGPGVPGLLMQIIQDPEMMKYHRLRALGLLQYYPDRPEVQSFLTSLLSEKDLPSGFLRAAIRTLGRSAKGKAIDTLTPFLSSEDVHIREAAAQALFETGDPSTGALLKGAAAKEPEPFLKKNMAEMSQRLETGKPNKDEDVSLGGANQKSPKGIKSKK